MPIINGINVPPGNAGSLPPFTPTQVIPFNPSQTAGSIGEGAGNAARTATNGQGDIVTRVIVGATDALTNISEHILIYSVFAIIFIMLLWVVVSDQSPIDIIKTVSKAGLENG